MFVYKKWLESSENKPWARIYKQIWPIIIGHIVCHRQREKQSPVYSRLWVVNLGSRSIFFTYFWMHITKKLFFAAVGCVLYFLNPIFLYGYQSKHLRGGARNKFEDQVRKVEVKPVSHRWSKWIIVSWARPITPSIDHGINKIQKCHQYGQQDHQHGLTILISIHEYSPHQSQYFRQKLFSYFPKSCPWSPPLLCRLVFFDGLYLMMTMTPPPLNNEWHF